MARKVINKKKHYCTGFDSMQYSAWGWQRTTNFLSYYSQNSLPCILYRNNRKRVLSKNDLMDMMQDWTVYDATEVDKI